MRYQAINNYVNVSLLKQEDEDGKIALAASKAPSPRWGRVESVGPGVPDLTGKIIPPSVKERDLVHTMAHGREPVFFNPYDKESEISVFSELDIMVKVIDEKELTIQPLGSLIEIEKIDNTGQTKSGLLIPPNQIIPTGIGIVKTLGLGWRGPDGTPIPFQVKVGDKVGYRQFNTLEIDFNPLGVDKKTYLISHSDICIIIKDEDN